MKYHRPVSLALISLALQVGCSGDLLFGSGPTSRAGSLGESEPMFSISPEEGLLSHHDPAVAYGHASDIRAVGARMIRLQFCDWVEDTGEIAPGQLERLHRMIDVARDAGLRIYAELNYCSVVPAGFEVGQWHDLLNSGGEQTVAMQQAWHNGFVDSPAGNRYAQAFAEATRAFAEEFGDQVDYWEIWNEPNGAPDGSWDDTCSGRYGVSGGGINWSLCPKQLGVVTSKAFEVLANVDPDARVIAGNMLFHGEDYWVAKDYWEQVYRSEAVRQFRANNGRYPWHAVGIHPYGVPAYAPADDPKNGLREQVEDFRRHMAGDDSARIAITEYGWTTNLDHGDTRVVADELSQAMQVRDTYPLAAELGLELVMWFNMRDALSGGYYFGIQRADGTFKAAASAFCEVAGAVDCAAGKLPEAPPASGRVASRADGVTDPAIAACHVRNGSNGAVLDNGGGPHVHRWGGGWVQDLRDLHLGDTMCMRADTRTTALMVRGAIRDTYLAAGGGPGPLGYPADEEHAAPSGPFQSFRGGYITWSPAAGAFVAFDHASNPI